MIEEFVPAVGWVAFLIFSILILLWDASRLRAQANKPGGNDQHKQVRIGNYVIGAVFVGGLVLIGHFWVTRKSFKGALLGLGAMLLAGLSAGMVQLPAGKLAHAHDLKLLEETCKAPQSKSKIHCAFSALDFPEHKERLLKLNCEAGAIDGCSDLDKLVNNGDFPVGYPRTDPGPFSRMKALCSKVSKEQYRTDCFRLEPPKMPTF